ncbi:histidine phosphatase family protein [Pendulispora rubella]|uniref:Histidine phosphatase family protein n=1 Tax=Pendulispora rubella TaxID=2741070 RepID=A0ABZ2L878_9BACT
MTEGLTRRLWVARHAPIASPGERCYGRTDVAVTVPHDRAAALLAESFPSGEPRPNTVWTSPVSRCAAVAEHLAGHFGAAFRVDAALYEMDFGAWDGVPWTDIRARDDAAYARWMREWEHVAPPGGEAPQDMERRVRTWLTSLSMEQPERSHGLVAHAGVVRALYVVLEGCPWPDAMGRAVEHLAWVPFRLGHT